MAISKSAKKAYAKAYKKTGKKKSHWLFFSKGDSAKEIISKIITQLAVLVLAGCLVILANEARLSISTQMLSQKLQDIYHTVTDSITGGNEFSENPNEILPSAVKLLEINPDTIGWLSIDNTEINLPVVQRRSADGNDYYLKRDFNGASNKAGTLFLDMRDTLTAAERSQNLIIYGHNQKDRTMFGDLAKYKKDLQFYKDHGFLTFSSNYKTDRYVIFAAFVTAVESSQTADGIVFDYHNYIDMDKTRFEDFINNINLRNEYITPVDVDYGDEILTLSTCSNEFEPSRFVIFARKLRDGETIDLTLTEINDNAKEPDWNIIYK
ncbi:MAG: class B sortase [Ruminococcus sp.]|jgi:sortase B|nr:class B sortase [Ruminococcus sp.]